MLASLTFVFVCSGLGLLSSIGCLALECAFLCLPVCNFLWFLFYFYFYFFIAGLFFSGFYIWERPTTTTYYSMHNLCLQIRRGAKPGRGWTP
jgi:hypothetical protein